jgi:VWFA-related protein
VIARAAAIAGVVLASAMTLASQDQRPATPPPTQTFRSSTELVMVDVSVRDGGRPVPGLTAADFVLTDNGVRQQIESVEATAVPIDVTLVIDVSGDPHRPWTRPAPAVSTIAAIEADARKVTGLLRPDDRVRLLAIDTYTQQIWPLQPVAELSPIRSVASDGLSALYETLAIALLQPVEPARRHVIVARTKGRDTISAIGAGAIRDMAEKSDALLHLVLMEQEQMREDTLSTFQCQLMGLCWPTRRSWLPLQRRVVAGGAAQALSLDGQALDAAAQATRGDLHQSGALTVPSLASTFTKAFEDFRSGYVLRYTPRGATRQGWHALSVTVPRFRNYTVRARTGYGVDDPLPPKARPAVAATPKTLAELTNAYEQRAYQAMAAGLRQVTDPAKLLQEFVEGGNPWPGEPHREAAFAVELAEPAVFSPRATTRDAGDKLLDRYARLIRHPIEPDEFERAWYFAVMTQFQGALRPAAIEAFADRALARFPGEPRFLLAKAIAADQRTAVGLTGSLFARSTVVAATESARTQYEALLKSPEVAAEAHLRLAHVLLRSGRAADAVPHLIDASLQGSPDPYLRFLQRLFIGHVLVALDRPEQAADMFRAALTILPSSHSARVGLMNTLFRRGDREAAEAVAERLQTETSRDIDPWWMYWQAQYRLHAQAVAQLRGLSR